MTIIVAQKIKNKIILASDNQTSAGWYKLETSTANSLRAKLLKISEDFAIASAGDVKEITIFQRFCQRVKPKSANENDIYDFMVDFKDYCKKTMDNFSFNSAYIIIYNKKIFQIMYWFDVQEKNEYCALWSWMFEALVALDMWWDAIKAVEMAKKFDAYCGWKTMTIELDL